MPIHKNTVMMVLREQQLNYSHSKTNKHNKYEGESISILLEEIMSTWSYNFKLNIQICIITCTIPIKTAVVLLGFCFPKMLPQKRTKLWIDHVVMHTCPVH